MLTTERVWVSTGEFLSVTSGPTRWKLATSLFDEDQTEPKWHEFRMSTEAVSRDGVTATMVQVESEPRHRLTLMGTLIEARLISAGRERPGVDNLQIVIETKAIPQLDSVRLRGNYNPLTRQGKLYIVTSILVDTTKSQRPTKDDSQPDPPQAG
jgi:hypothetical protein